MDECQGKVVVVTGGTSGIGRETAVLFAKKGARVVVAGRREKEGEQSLDLIRRAGGEGIFVKADVSRAADVRALIGKTVETYGRLDCAFNNAGVEGSWALITEQTEEEWDRTIDINLKGTWLCLKSEIEQMARQGTAGAIVNNSSIAGLIGTRGTAIYSASKHGLLGLTKALAIEWAHAGIRINAVCPAVIETPMADRLYAAPEVNRWALGFHPLGRFGKAAEVAQAVVWLCSDAASYITGQAMVIDGGFLAGPNPPQQ
jgi:NAD(P)-dependent dehydrogenase (short-subunit alcohol dehydrogenase family)